MRALSFSRQPLVWLHVIALAVGLAATFGLHLTAAQAAAVLGLGEAIAAALGWTRVTPTSSIPTAPDAADPLAALVEQVRAEISQRTMDTLTAALQGPPAPPVSTGLPSPSATIAAP